MIVSLGAKDNEARNSTPPRRYKLSNMPKTICSLHIISKNLFKHVDFTQGWPKTMSIAWIGLWVIRICPFKISYKGILSKLKLK